MSRTSSSQGEANSYKYGLFKRKLPGSTVFRFTSDESPESGIVTKRLRLRGISSLLNVSIAAGLQGPEGSSRVVYPANPGTINVVPFVDPPDIRAPLSLKPLSLVPQTLPHAFALGGGFAANGGDFPLMGQLGTVICDGADIEIEVDSAAYAGTTLNAVLVVVCAAEYNGSWWDVDTIEALLSKFEVENAKASTFSTL